MIGNRTWNVAAKAPFLFIFCLCLLLATGAAAGAAIVSVDDSAAQDLVPGDVFDVVVSLDSDGELVSTLDIDLEYDPVALEVKSITQNGLFGATVNSDYIVVYGSGDDGAGTVSYGLAGTVAEAKSGSFVTVEFKVLDDASNGTYPLELSRVELLYGASEISVSSADGAAVVGEDSSGDEPIESGEPEVCLSPATVNAEPGDVFDITVKLDSADELVSTLDVKLAYDPSVMKINSITQNGLFGATADTDYIVVYGSGDDGAGTVSYGLAGTVAEAKKGDFVTIGCEILATAANGSCSVSITSAELLNGANSVSCAKAGDTTVVVSSTPVEAGIVLYPGWNLISVPEVLESPGIDDVLGNFSDEEIDAVFCDDLSTGVNVMSVPDNFEPLKAYWVHSNMSSSVVIKEEYLAKASSPTTPPALKLYPGWNAIGHTALETQSAELALFAADDCYVKIKGPWVTATEEYACIGLNTDDISGLDDSYVTTGDFEMNVYEGYYILVQEECILG